MQKLTSQQILTAIGPSAPVALAFDAASAPSTSYQPVLAVTFSNDANLAAVIEGTFDDPDPNGNVASNAAWFQIQEWNQFGTSSQINGAVGAGASKTAVMGGSGYCGIFRNFSHVRVRVITYVAGSLTMIVRQVYLAALH